MYISRGTLHARIHTRKSVLSFGQLRTTVPYVAFVLQRTIASQEAVTASELHTPPDPVDCFLHGSSTRYLDATYHQWRKDPTSVHVSWQIYFENLDDTSLPATSAFNSPPGLVPGVSGDALPAADSNALKDLRRFLYASKAREIIYLYREYGHLKAKVNPLGQIAEVNDQHDVSLPSATGFGANDIAGFDADHKVDIDGKSMTDLVELRGSSFNLREVIAICEQIYCGSIGMEFFHVTDPAKRAWLSSRVKSLSFKSPTTDEKKKILDGLTRGTVLERFLANKFPNEKRFGLDGLEAMVPGLSAAIDHSADSHGIEKIILSQCHRGRLNMFSSVFQQSPEWLFRQFAGLVGSDVENGRSGDVKYHYGMKGERTTTGGNNVEIEVLPNPSHLEATGPAAQGKTRAAQDMSEDPGRLNVMPIAMHTDGAISGQGSVYEVLNLSKLKGYDVGGTIRITVNNQVGFTTDPASARSTRYCTDIAKFVEAPIFHVNSEDPEAVIHVFRLAADWRAKFHSDVMIDFVCYRRFGHNEIDQASFTQPEMYKTIADRTPVLEAYAEELVRNGVIDADFIKSSKQHHWDELEQILRRSQEPATSSNPAVGSSIPNIQAAVTAVNEDALADILGKITQAPEGFTAHKTLLRVLRSKQNDFEAGDVDWATAEALAFGSLLREGHRVRLSGEDVERGTFSQRHSVFHDQITYKKWTPLNNLGDVQAPYSVYNSPLSEFGVLGFDYGYSLGAQDSLTVWEAQFGDFVNNAQVIVDQFVASGEAKWGLQSNIVLSLPHGYDGQGPEHSSARLGRFLELCNEAPDAIADETLQQQNCNIRVLYPTTPANLFHALRRQVLFSVKKRKPVPENRNLLY